MIDPHFLKGFNQIILEKSPVVIIPHLNPDGDAIGSALALCFFLISKEVPTSIISPNEIPKFIRKLPKFNRIDIAKYNPDQAQEKIRRASAIFCLDFNTLNRSGPVLTEAIKSSHAGRFLIDHHQNPNIEEFNYICVDTKAPATAQVVYRIIVSVGGKHAVDKDMAACLYTGIMTDTGSFHYASTTSETHRIAAHLLETGINPTVLHANVYDNYTMNRMQMLAKALANMQYWPEWSTACVYLTREDLLRFRVEKGDTEGFVNYALMIEGVKLAIFLKEDTEQDFIKLSLRSKEPLDVNQMARKYFNGGGHVCAAGGRLDLSMQEAFSVVKKVLPNYKDLLKVPSTKN